jgi:hypothetical protein
VQSYEEDEALPNYAQNKVFTGYIVVFQVFIMSKMKLNYLADF